MKLQAQLILRMSGFGSERESLLAEELLPALT
jgi:hypothetical protein